ncbi:MAG: sulfate adenylyltransferase subunit CysD [Sphingobacteriales bacterium]|nr:MAG: sulfate adenylyltransferase subunit CysD [Sphingobacteriales bacterium]
MTHLDELESEAIFIIREAYAQFENPCILYSGGKDSIVLTHVAAKAFLPAPIPFTLVHIDTGHNFPETLNYRDAYARKLNANLVVGSVQDSINRGTVAEEKGPQASRNRLQTTTLLETIQQHQFDACLTGARRDEEKARAKERIFSHRDAFGQWQPKHQRPELWNILNGKKSYGEHFRIFPLSNWTELDIWLYIMQEQIELPELYYAHERDCIIRNGVILAVTEHISLMPGEHPQAMSIRFRTMGDATITGAVRSMATNTQLVIEELLNFSETERGNRMDDKRSETSMEDRKKEGYF